MKRLYSRLRWWFLCPFERHRIELLDREVRGTVGEWIVRECRDCGWEESTWHRYDDHDPLYVQTLRKIDAP